VTSSDLVDCDLYHFDRAIPDQIRDLAPDFYQVGSGLLPGVWTSVLL
jgi:hypothetical protein